jgi:4-hydroxybutyryl-CoA dehydratase/vinylacetyl-CoA-Delta-isomerase
MNPETREYVLKYLQTKEGVAVEDRMRLLRWIENQLMGRGAVAYITESIHGAGSPQAQRVMMTRFADMEGLRNLAKKLIEIDMPKKPDTN